MSHTTQRLAGAITRRNEIPGTQYPVLLESQHFQWHVSNRNHDPVVYVFRADNGLFKIGRASDVVVRLSALDNASPIPIRFYHLILTNNAYELETVLHELFAPDWVRGEWFGLSLEQAATLGAIQRHDLPESRIPGKHSYRRKNYGTITVTPL